MLKLNVSVVQHLLFSQGFSQNDLDTGKILNVINEALLPRLRIETVSLNRLHTFHFLNFS